MMTFIVIGNFILNATLLSDKHLGKQRIEAKQIIDSILGGTGWKHHPIVHAWRNYVPALKYYANCCISEWVKRGHKNDMPYYEVPKLILMPWWAKWDRLHQSHRAMLLRKNPFHYHDKFTVDPEYMLYGYIWPHNIPYERQNAPLNEITAAIPDNLIHPIYCLGVLKSGNRKGDTCNLLVKTPTKFPATTNPSALITDNDRIVLPYCKTHGKPHIL